MKYFILLIALFSSASVFAGGKYDKETCTDFQIIVYATKGNGITSEVLSYCTIDEAQNKLEEINSVPFVKLPKAGAGFIQQVAQPLFSN